MVIALEGLDFSGKTICAHALSELTGFEYIKIKKGSILNFEGQKSQYDIVSRIIEEISTGIAKKSDIILDRSYLSALITGQIFDTSLEIDSMLEQVPLNLKNPNLGLIVEVSHKTAISRVSNPTAQDKAVLGADYDHYQSLLVNIGIQEGYKVFNNSTQRSPKELKKSLEKVLVKYFY